MTNYVLVLSGNDIPIAIRAIRAGTAWEREHNSNPENANTYKDLEKRICDALNITYVDMDLARLNLDIELEKGDYDATPE